ncbi:hypothetical protein PG993_010316 [Apiospora rasikravindrae]|uniref:PAC domain-containing protein n=1 Tax=Apiospora rasikravindrae TaxID=990691 RepID=A0ABR1SLZ2_9PEZI
MSARRRIISPLRPMDKVQGYPEEGRESSLSVRSISAFDHHPGQHPQEEEEYDEEGAAIPDIPTRKSSRAQDLVDFITSPEAFKNVRKTKFKEEINHNPHSQSLGVPQVSRPNSSSSNREQPSSGRLSSLRDNAPTERAASPRTPQSPRFPQDQGPGERLSSMQDHEPAERGQTIRQYSSAERLPSARDYHTPQSRRRSVGPDDQLSVAQSTTQRSMFSSRSQMNSSSSSLMLPTSLPALQTKGGDVDNLEPLAEEEVDPASFDLVVPAHSLGMQYSLETQAELLFSVKHLSVIFDDPVLLQRFTTYLCSYRPQSVRILVYYLDAMKALKAIQYANAVTEALAPIDGLEYTKAFPAKTMNCGLKEKMRQAFETIANHDLPAYITHTYVQTVSLTIKRRIADTLPVHLRDMSEGLAEVFCLTDPSRPDNPIVFASEEFHKTTQYGMDYVLGRNCRFLQGPKTNPFSVKRIREKLEAGKEHVETFLNYRRDGSPFMNLLMVAPLFDSRGKVRYHIGAQVDVSGLVKESAGLDSLERLVARENPELMPHHYQQQQQSPQKPDHKRTRHAKFGDAASVRTHGNGVEKANGVEKTNGASNGDYQLNGGEARDEFRELAAMFTMQELRTVRESGGALHRVHQEDISSTENVANWHKPRILVRDDAELDRRDSDPVLHDSYAVQDPGTNASNAGIAPSSHRRIGSGGNPASVHSSERIYMGPDPSSPSSSPLNIGGGRLSGVYEHYLLVRPYPSLKILFASPSLRVPGMLQSSFLSRCGGSPRLREAIESALADGQGVTAKVRWLSSVSGSAASQNVEDGTTPGRGRWIHATPLLGSNGAVGVWMVVLVDDEAEASRRHPREAPPVERYINGRRPRFNNQFGGAGDYAPSEDGLSLGGFAEKQHHQQQQQHQPRRGDNVGARRVPADFAEPPMRNANRARSSEITRIDSF